ncbi:hypothetical protein [Corynebacterium tuberculostearicum]|uniref:hypothetical protein n=1 Tax=Corynebacterium tuberculostearicum TaxID=38304 RepID=UPI00293517E1|nr:hypothetical protein [Corynebacterium tuberculostearicum]MDV2435431.1 hypothetical protein [Corynebacterium tuberculostearicum]
MKRLPQTLTAAVLTGALAFGGAAVAQAEETETPGVQPGTEAATENADTAETADTTETEGTPVADAPAGSEGEENTTPVTPEGEEESENSAPDTTDSSAPATKKDAEGNEWYQSLKDPKVYVNDSALVNEEITDEMRNAYAEAFPSENPEPGFDKKKLAWLALPAALVIGGITWYLSQDGKTYVKDEARKNQEPTAEEKAASEQMLNANKDEVIAQGGQLAEGDAAQADAPSAPSAPAAGETADSARGMSAETGSNSVAQALAALAVAAMVAAGAFAARRKFFA